MEFFPLWRGSSGEAISRVDVASDGFKRLRARALCSTDYFSGVDAWAVHRIKACKIARHLSAADVQMHFLSPGSRAIIGSNELIRTRWGREIVGPASARDESRARDVATLIIFALF